MFRHGILEAMLSEITKRIRRILRPPVQPAVAAAACLTLSLALAAPLLSNGQGHAQFNALVRETAGFGGPLLGLDVSSVRQNPLSLAHDLGQSIRIADHGTMLRSPTMGLAVFLSRGRIWTVADALRWFSVPLTPAQASALRLCRSLDTLKPGEVLTIQPDPWQRGIASWYGPGFHGRLAASGEIYNMYDRTAAHKTLPLQSLVRVVSQRTGTSIVVRINDRGPYVGGRIIDLSHRAKELLGMEGGLAAVYIERLEPSALDTPCP